MVFCFVANAVWNPKKMWVAVRAARAAVLELLWAEGEENLLENLLFSWAST